MWKRGQKDCKSKVVKNFKEKEFHEGRCTDELTVIVTAYIKRV